MYESMTTGNRGAIIVGEPGTNKGVVAKAMHDGSERRDGPFVPLDCRIISQSLLDSELFGHRCGTIDTAPSDFSGRLLLAREGTLYIRCVERLSVETQRRLAEEAGATVIAATHLDVEARIASGKFCRELFDSLLPNRITVRPLREDRARLTNLLQSARDQLSYSPEAYSLLLDYEWPGNDRQLEALLERLADACAGSTIREADLPQRIRTAGKVFEDGIGDLWRQADTVSGSESTPNVVHIGSRELR